MSIERFITGVKKGMEEERERMEQARMEEQVKRELRLERMRAAPSPVGMMVGRAIQRASPAVSAISKTIKAVGKAGEGLVAKKKIDPDRILESGFEVRGIDGFLISPSARRDEDRRKYRK